MERSKGITIAIISALGVIISGAIVALINHGCEKAHPSAQTSVAQPTPVTRLWLRPKRNRQSLPFRLRSTVHLGAIRHLPSQGKHSQAHRRLRQRRRLKR